MYPNWSIRIWENYVSETALKVGDDGKFPDWIRIAFLRYWTTTDKWYGY